MASIPLDVVHKIAEWIAKAAASRPIEGTMQPDGPSLMPS